MPYNKDQASHKVGIVGLAIYNIKEKKREKKTTLFDVVDCMVVIEIIGSKKNNGCFTQGVTFGLLIGSR